MSPFVTDAMDAAEKAMAAHQGRCGDMRELAAVGIAAFLTRLEMYPTVPIGGVGVARLKTRGLGLLAADVAKEGKRDA